MHLRKVWLCALGALAIMNVAVSGQDAPAAAPGMLYAHWPPDAVPGTAIEVPMDAAFPVGEPDLSSGPAAPGTTAGEGNAPLPEFIYMLVNATGAPGPAADLRLDASQPAVLTAYFSADQTAVPSAVPVPPEQNPDYGVAPQVTVEAEIYLAGELAGTGSQTQDLVSTPVGQVVYQYDVPITFTTTDVPANAGVRVVFRLYQLDQDGERTMQNFWNINTGEDYPTGLLLPALNPDALTTAPANITGDTDAPPETSDDTPIPVLVPALGLAGAAWARRRRT